MNNSGETLLLIHENISKIIKQKGLNKKEFAIKLIDLKPTVSRIGETPSLSAIYSYLNGRINIPVELIPYVCDVLDVTEQELFDTTQKRRKRCFKYFVESANIEELEYFNNFINSQITHNININYGKVVMSSSPIVDNKKLDKFIELLEFAPHNFLNRAIDKLKEYRKIDNKF